MVRRAERPAVGQRSAGELAGDRGDHRHVEQLARIERRQDRGQALRQHRLAGAGRPDHQQIVAAGRRHLQRPPRHLLAAHVAEVGQSRRELAPPRHRPGAELVAAQVVDQRQQRFGRHDLDVVARPRRLRPRGRRADDTEVAPVRRDRGRQHPVDARQPAVEPELADRHIAVERVGGEGADGGHQRQRDRQIVMAALLGQIGRRQVHDDAPRRQAEPRRDQRRLDPLARLLDRLVGQPDDDHARRQAAGDLRLHVHRHGLDALERHGLHAGNHRTPHPSGKP